MKMVLIVAVVAVVLAGAFALFLATGAWKQVGSRFEDTASVGVAITEIRVADPGLANVDIRRTAAASGIEIHRTVYYLSPLRDPPGVTHRVDGTTLVLDQCGFLCAVDYLVDAPEDVRVVR